MQLLHWFGSMTTSIWVAEMKHLHGARILYRGKRWPNWCFILILFPRPILYSVFIITKMYVCSLGGGEGHGNLRGGQSSACSHDHSKSCSICDIPHAKSDRYLLLPSVM